MNNYLRITGDGIIGKEPTIKETANGKKYVEFIIAINDAYKNSAGDEKKTTEWLNCRYFSEDTEKTINELAKGHHVFVSGTLKLNSYKKGEEYKMSPYILVGEMGRFAKKNPVSEEMQASLNEVKF